MRAASLQSVDQPITVVCVHDDPAYLDALGTAFDGSDDLRMILDTDPATALDRLGDAAAVVCPVDLQTTAETTVFEAVRQRDPTLPVLFTVSPDLSEVDDALFDADGTEFHSGTADSPQIRLFERRLRALVARARLERRVGQFRTALDLGRDPTLVVDGDGTIAYANQALSSAVTTDRASLVGREWTDIFTAESVRHLRVDAFPVAEDGWTWTGCAVLTTDTGEVEARTSLVRLSDRSVVFVVHGLSSSEETRE
ncbi:PAS domain-containing protein [Halobaculum marinum]|uniref:PAS domain-containing protein n=1 Tax=Halobaculum marinum TaxID=3031996 RepID=A0ABD5X4J4_9EURY|nr:PAS domain-containing protein [Halobaculum sp. DT55]